ncbi:hypothetical protein SLEP1_g1471 [Rubroshorea leprosula]|uniref:CP12 domain-containing protein n=1 Tax=Rubroshorea leprosula TaxID=152421 RepID=A0AAV5HPC0_9ROSI|nr:hypothetical protein SLEP1_g1471 [Rubroshorea leprosula]
MATITGLSLSTPKVQARMPDMGKPHLFRTPYLNQPWRRASAFGSGRLHVRPVRAAPDRISEKVEESIKSAEAACADDPASGECVAAWDEVEELSAAASHARDKKKEYDPLENYCKDNPETKECRTYDN